MTCSVEFQAIGRRKQLRAVDSSACLYNLMSHVHADARMAEELGATAQIFGVSAGE
jgi:hypothetical protein